MRDTLDKVLCNPPPLKTHSSNSPLQRILPARGRPVLINGATLGRKKGTGPPGPISHTQHDTGKEGVISECRCGVLVQKFSGGDPKPILHPDDVIRIQIHIHIRAAYREALDAWMTCKPKRPVTYGLRI
jgi:hypothetical protein